MNPKYDVAVIGAGIVGTACADELARRGLRVAVVEAGPVGGGATAAGMGHVVIMDDSPAQLALTCYAQSLWNELAPQLPADADYNRCGTLWIAADKEEMEEVERKHGRYAAVGIETKILDRHALEAAEPNLRRPLAGALHVPSDSVLYPQRVAAFLAERAQKNGAELLLGSTVIANDGNTILLRDGASISATRIVHATGASATQLMPQLPVKKRKGHLIITDRHPDLVRHQMIELGYMKSAHSIASDSVAFNVQPRRTGQLVIGSSRQYEDESSEINQKIVTAMLARASEYLPPLRALSSFRVWTGFRAATPDKLPIIGPTLNPAILLATGHEGLGITTSLATARLLADSLMGRKPTIPIEPYLPARFMLQEKL